MSCFNWFTERKIIDPTVDFCSFTSSLSLFRGVFSLAIQNLHIRSLGLRSLRSVSGGLVLLHNNSQLCYTSSLPWGILLHPTQGPHRIVSQNQDAQLCGGCNAMPRSIKDTVGCTLIGHFIQIESARYKNHFHLLIQQKSSCRKYCFMSCILNNIDGCCCMVNICNWWIRRHLSATSFLRVSLCFFALNVA